MNTVNIFCIISHPAEHSHTVSRRYFRQKTMHVDKQMQLTYTVCFRSVTNKGTKLLTEDRMRIALALEKPRLKNKIWRWAEYKTKRKMRSTEENMLIRSKPSNKRIKLLRTGLVVYMKECACLRIYLFIYLLHLFYEHYQWYVIQHEWKEKKKHNCCFRTL